MRRRTDIRSEDPRNPRFGPCMDGSPLARGSLSVLQLLVGAAMYPTCRCGLSYAAGHNAIRAAQVPIESSHSKCTAPLGSPDPAVSTGFVHQLLSALSNLVGDPRALSRSMRRPAPCSVRRSSSMPRPSGRSCWRAQPLQPWSFAAPSVARAMAAWSRSARHSG